MWFGPHKTRQEITWLERTEKVFPLPSKSENGQIVQIVRTGAIRGKESWGASQVKERLFPGQIYASRKRRAILLIVRCSFKLMLGDKQAVFPAKRSHSSPVEKWDAWTKHQLTFSFLVISSHAINKRKPCHPEAQLFVFDSEVLVQVSVSAFEFLICFAEAVAVFADIWQSPIWRRRSETWRGHRKNSWWRKSHNDRHGYTGSRQSASHHHGLSQWLCGTSRSLPSHCLQKGVVTFERGRLLCGPTNGLQPFCVETRIVRH